MLYIGADPGKSGAVAVLDGSGAIVCVVRNSGTLSDRWAALSAAIGTHAAAAALERVHAMPGQGVTSCFTFGAEYGVLHAWLIALGVEIAHVSPQVWQREMQCLTRGKKNVSKAAAQARWPAHKVTHADADALLLAEWVRLTKRVRHAK